MVDNPSDVKQPVAPVTAPSPVPASKEQQAPAAVAPAGDSSKDVKESLVPLPALQEERSKRQALESEVAELRRMVSQPQVQAPQQQQNLPDPKVELEKLWENDPRKAVQVEIMYAMDWRDRIDANLEVQADQMARNYPDFNNYRSTALGQVRSLPLNQRGSRGILEAAYFMVRGQNADTMIQQREAELLEKYRRGEITAAGLATPPGSFSSPAPVQGVQLTQDELRVADAMGLSPEGYASQKRAA